MSNGPESYFALGTWLTSAAVARRDVIDSACSVSALHQCRCSVCPQGFYCGSRALPQDGSAGLMPADALNVGIKL